MMTRNLIASDRVEGAAVCRSSGEKIGTIERLMIDKHSGQVAYAVLSFGGLLHFGAKHFPVPWASLSYNAVRKAYEVDITEEQLRNPPLFVGDHEFDWGDLSREIAARNVHRTNHYWE
jgi:hypothetical protein